MPTGIDYLDEVWNPVTGCSGKDCKAHCWARGMVRRFPHLHGYDKNMEQVPFHRVQFHPSRLDKPLHWKKPRRVGVCFLGDLFDEQVPFEWIHQVWAVMKACPQHQFFVLTKQPQRMAESVGLIYRKEALGHAKGFWSHVYLGVSPTDQTDADRMIPELLKVPGKKCLSIEPMLGPVDMRTGIYEMSYGLSGTTLQGIAWVVLGCESGPKRRPCYWPWMIDVVEQCKAANVPVYVKQMVINGKVSHDPQEWPAELRVRELP